MHMRRRAVILWVLVAAGCSDEGHFPLEREALARWKTLGVHDYVVRQEMFCFCLNGGRIVEVVVRADTISSGTAIDGKSEPIEKQFYQTVDGLFAYIAKATTEGAAELSVTYHELYGYPELIAIDWIAEAVDDEMSYHTFEFRALR